MIGCKKVIGVDRVASRLELARSLGASDGINTSSADIDLATEVKKLTNGDGATVVVDTTGVPAVLEAGLAATASRGRFVFLGITPPGYTLPLDASAHMTVRSS